MFTSAYRRGFRLVARQDRLLHPDGARSDDGGHGGRQQECFCHFYCHN